MPRPRWPATGGQRWRSDNRGALRVRVPASIANLGPGFDVLAMAVDLWLEVEAEPAERPDWSFEGESAEFLGSRPNPLSALSMRGRVRNQIPVGVGLGSSAAARVAAWALRGREDPWLAAAEEEGHADNAVASGLGGLRLVVDGRIEELLFQLFRSRSPSPSSSVSASASRASSRWHSPQPACSSAASRPAVPAGQWKAMTKTQPEPLPISRLHQPWRRPLYPWTSDAIAAANGLGFPAAVSGAGPSVFALCGRGRGREVAEAMAAAAPGRGRPLVTEVSRSGMCWDP